MTLEEYDQRTAELHAKGNEIFRLKLALRAEEDRLFKDAGLSCHGYEPDAPCWTHKGLAAYYNTAREVIEALEKK